jgi:chromosome segregation ATPase
VTGILSYCLAWCCRGSDEKVIPELVVHNEKEKRDAIKAHKKGEISKDELDRQLEEWDRKIERQKADVERMKRLYTSFCENVLDRLPRDSP